MTDASTDRAAMLERWRAMSHAERAYAMSVIEWCAESAEARAADLEAHVAVRRELALARREWRVCDIPACWRWAARALLRARGYPGRELGRVVAIEEEPVVRLAREVLG